MVLYKAPPGRRQRINRHGLRDVAQKHLVNFRDGAKGAARDGNRRPLIFSMLCGYMNLEGDAIGALAEPSAQTFYTDLERKAMAAAGENNSQSDGSLVWVPIDRAIELMRTEFKHAKISDVSKWTMEVEELLRLPDEIFEINKAKDTTSGFVDTKTKGGDAGARPGSPAAGGESNGGVPTGFDVIHFEQKPQEEQTRILRRREDALVQNKVLRALTRRGISLRELFSMLDADGSGEIDPEEFIQGIQQLEGQLTDAQCQRLMEITDTDNSGTVDFNELTRALQKLDLRVEMHDYLIVCLRFFAAEMQRSAKMLRTRFNEAAAKRSGGGGGKPSTLDKLMGDEGGDDADSSKKLGPDGVRALLKSLDAPFQVTVVQKLIGEMVAFQKNDGMLAAPVFKRQSVVSAPVEKVDAAEEITCEAFVKVMMSYGFHAVASPAFKETGLGSTANILMAVNAFAKKAPIISTRKTSLKPDGAQNPRLSISN